MINSIRGKGNWNYQKGKLKETFAILTDELLTAIMRMHLKK
jgi:uncharacterized protein YjbJ (UPF0337 family)